LIGVVFLNSSIVLLVASAVGYNGQQYPFTIACYAGADGSNLPTAGTCFNTLRLPANYANQAALKKAIHAAIGMSQGFDEGVVAE
jgi:hypothetical protein